MRGELTGFKVLMISLAAFGVIIAVNLVMAWQAVATFPGIEVENSYQASQEFDRDRTAQLALNWTVSAQYGDGVLEISMTGPDGSPAEVAEMHALVGWATSTKDDVAPEFTRKGAVFSSPLALVDGNWTVHLKAIASDGTKFQRRIPMIIKQGRG